MQRLNQGVLHQGRAYPAGTVRDAAPGVPDGPWWDGEPEQKPAKAAAKPRRPRASSDED